MRVIDKKLLIPFILVTSLFFLWGLAANMTDTLLAAFKKIMSMNDFQTSWIQVAYYGSYFCLALPAAILIRKFEYKTGILVGLGLFAAGALLFYPASRTMEYSHFLIALFILAGGLSILETTANPYILRMGNEANSTRRLNLAQSFNPIGSITGIILSKYFILANLDLAGEAERAQMSAEALTEIQARELNAVMGPYVGIALFLIILWAVIALYKMPRASEEKHLDLINTFKRLGKNQRYIWGVIAQFFYVGAQIGVWSFTIRYAMAELNLDEEGASNYYLASIVLFMASRFICTWLMNFISERKLLVYLSIAAAMLTIGVIVGDGYFGVFSLIAISGCMSLMFPTIFGLGVAGLGNDTKIGGSGMIMAILGGALLTMIQAWVSDSTGSINTSYWVPFICFLVIIYYAAYKVVPGKR